MHQSQSRLLILLLLSIFLGQVLGEMGKDKPSQKQVDHLSSNFLKTLNHVEFELSKHINYLTQVSTGQAHEGSSYAAQKTLQMAWHRGEHARSKVTELERTKNHLLGGRIAAQQQRLQQQQQQFVPTSTSTAAPMQGQGQGPGPSTTTT